VYQNDNLKTHEAVAKETGVSPATIMRDAAYAEAGKRNMASEEQKRVATVATL
jgi:hypothetical protein